MIESPVLIELLEERERECYHRVILQILARRFGAIPEALAAQVHSVQNLDQLKQLINHAIDCPDLDAFLALAS